MREWVKEDRTAQVTSEIAGVGLPAATASVAMMGDPNAFSSDQEFAAWGGFVPK